MTSPEERASKNLPLTFSEYQSESRTTAVYPDVGRNYVYPALGLAGEAGEVCEKIKKVIRDKGGEISEDDRKALAKELGDVLWYVSQLASEVGLSLALVAQQNLDKLRSRKDRGKLHGSGDER